MPRPPSMVRGDANRRQRAIARARELQPIINEMRQKGIKSWYGLANALNERGLRSLRGGLWSGAQLRRLLLIGEEE